MKVQEIMTSHVKTVSSDINFYDAARLMRDLDVGVLPVVEGEKPVGLVTDRDIVVRGLAEDHDPKSTLIRQIMSSPVERVYLDDEVDSVMNVMKSKQIRRVVVVDRNNEKIQGIVSLGDVATEKGADRKTSEVLEQVSQPSRPKTAA